MAELRWGAGTHTGQIRPENEDDLHASDGVFVVADGMGGHEAGEVASALAVERIRDVLLAEDLAPTAERVVEAITDANGDIFRAAIATPGQSGMGTTVTAIAIIEDPMAGRGAPNIDDNDGVEPERVTPITPRVQPEALVLANVGDSRTYLYRHGRLRRVTIDHSYVQELVSTGHITDDEARTHPRRNIITRALGIEPDVKVDWWTLPLVRNDRFLLCSDGLVDEVDDDAIADVLEKNEDPQTAVDLLIAMANEAGGRDNVTVIVVDVLDGDDPPDPTQEIDLTPVWADDPNLTEEDIARIESGEVSLTGAVAARRLATDEVAPDSLSRKERRKARKEAKRSGDDTPTEAATDSNDDSGGDDSRSDDTNDSADSTAASDEESGRSTSRLGRIVAVFVVVALLMAGFVAFAAWARRGYFVDFDSNDQVRVYQGKPGGVLWFDPTAETQGSIDRADLTDDSAADVDDRREFSNLADAVLFVRGLETDAAADEETDAETETDPTTDDAADDEPGPADDDQRPADTTSAGSDDTADTTP